MNDATRTACPSCGHQDPAGTRFCTECGTSLAAAATAAPAALTCAHCGSMVAFGQAFCAECGQPLVELAEDAAVTAPPPACRTCGGPLAPELSFCTNCGAPVAAASVPPAAPLSGLMMEPPAAAFPMGAHSKGGSLPPAPGPAGRRRWPWVAALVLLLAALGVGGLALVARDDGDGSSDVAKDDRPATVSATVGDQTTPSDPLAESDAASAAPDDPSESLSVDVPSSGASTGIEVPSPSATPPPVVPAGAVCWDGSTTPTVDACSRPQGVAGLSYVFPAMSGQSCTRLSGSAPGRKILMQCFGYLPDGTEIKINYSQWASVSAASAHYEGKGLSRTEDNGVYFFTGSSADGELNTAWVYKKEPYSASVYALDQEALNQALTTLVGGRAPNEVRGSAT